MLDKKTIWSCFVRSYFTGSAFNFHGLQNIGLLYAMEPALAKIYKQDSELQAAREKYMWHFNTHPIWVPLLLGMFVNLEQRTLRNELSSQGMIALKNTASYTLSAIGDSVVSGTLVPLWGMVMCCLLISGYTVPAMIFLFCGVLGLQLFRLATYIAGLRYGLGVIEKLRKFDIMQGGQRLKVLNGCVLALLIYLIIPTPVASFDLLIIILGIAAAGWWIFRRKIPRLAVSALVFVILWGVDIQQWL